MVKGDLIYITYYTKEIKPVQTEEIDATCITYEVSTEDLIALSTLPQDNLVLRRMFLIQEGNPVIDLIADNISCGRIIEGGIADDKAILAYYIVRKGLDPLLNLLTSLK